VVHIAPRQVPFPPLPIGLRHSRRIVSWLPRRGVGP
jgi:hypothetical protein